MSDFQRDQDLNGRGYTHFLPGNSGFIINLPSWDCIRVDESDTTDVSPIPRFVIVYLPIFSSENQGAAQPYIQGCHGDTNSMKNSF